MPGCNKQFYHVDLYSFVVQTENIKSSNTSKWISVSSTCKGKLHPFLLDKLLSFFCVFCIFLLEAIWEDFPFFSIIETVDDILLKIHCSGRHTPALTNSFLLLKSSLLVTWGLWGSRSLVDSLEKVIAKEVHNEKYFGWLLLSIPLQMADHFES